MYKQILAALFLLTYSYTFAQTNIGERTFQFKDEKRNRPLITEVWYPTTDTVQAGDKKYSPFVREYTVRDGRLPSGKLPLILISHGTGGDRLSLEWLAQSLVHNGYIVAAVDHWGNTTNNKIALQFLKAWERPLDISFVLTELLKDKSFGALVDAKRIGAAGFSFGGYTVIALAGGVANYPVMLNYYRTVGHKEVEVPEFPGLGKYLYDTTLINLTKHIPPLKDSRIRAFLALSPGTGPGFISTSQFKDVHAPVYIIGSAADSMAPVKTNAGVYHRLIKGSRYYQFPGKTGHYVMVAEGNDAVKKEVPIPFTDDPSVNRHQVHLKVDSIAADFFKRSLK